MAAVDFEKIKAEGLDVDFVKYEREGFETVKPEDHYRLKTHGLCAQRHEGYFMMRIRIPGGVIRAHQLELIADLAEKHGHGWGHLTTRGNLELHSVKIGDFLAIRERLAGAGITTRSSCGHTFRNILSCARDGVCPDQPFDLYPWVQKIHRHVFERADFYNRRLPRRLNVSFSGCAGCRADARINDIGFVAQRAGEGGAEALGFELWVAGSLGTAPRMGHKLRDFLKFEEVIPALEAVTELYCRHGERKNPAKARLKFLVEAWGIEKFRDEFEKLLAEFREREPGRPARADSLELPPAAGTCRPVPSGRADSLEPPPAACTSRPELEPELATPLVYHGEAFQERRPLGEGIYPQRQEGFFRVEFWVPLGEMRAHEMKAVAGLAREFADGRIYHTARQNFEFHWVKKQNVEPLLQAMAEVGFRPEHAESISNVVSCPGTSFCSLAVTSSQGAASVLAKEARSLRWDDAPELKRLTVNISGCPNSCAKHQVADIGFAGGMTEVGGIRRYGYQMYIGGKFNGDVRPGILIRKGIPDDLVFPAAESLVEIFRERRLPEEALADFVDRMGAPALAELLEVRLGAKHPVPVESPVSMMPGLANEGATGEPGILVGAVADWEKGPAKIIQQSDETVAVFKTVAGFRACQNVCPHAGGSLGEGLVEGDTVTCPLHGWQFDLKNGTCLNEPGQAVKIYPVEVKEGKVYLTEVERAKV
jgi:NAD(P)H-dependent nitrite reductase small subunit